MLKGKFSINADRGLLKPKKENINIAYIKNAIEPILRNLAKGRKGEKGQDEFTKVYPSMIEDVEIKMPINENGQFDLNAQNEVVDKINFVEEIKSNIEDYKLQLRNLSVDLANESNINFKELLINEVLDSPSTNSGLKKIHVFLNKTTKAYIPVYSASMNENQIFGWVTKDSKWKKYRDVLTWNKDGSSNYVFYRKDEFVPYEKVKVLKLKEEFSENLLYDYLKIVIQERMIREGFGFNYKCSMARVLKLEIPVPYDKMGAIDLQAQKNFAEKHRKIESIKKRIINELNKIANTDVDFITH